MLNLKELMAIRDDLWSKVKAVPGVVTIGLGSKLNQSALILFVDEKNVQKDELPTVISNVPIIVKPASQAQSQGVR